MGEYSIQPPMPLRAYYNMDMQDLDIEIGFFSTRLSKARRCQPVVYPAMAIASAMHKGPYDTLNVTYDALNAGSRSRATNLPAWSSNSISTLRRKSPPKKCSRGLNSFSNRKQTGQAQKPVPFIVWCRKLSKLLFQIIDPFHQLTKNCYV